MKYVLAIPYVIGFFIAAILSFPWILFGMGVGLQDMEAGDRIIGASPAARILERAAR